MRVCCPHCGIDFVGGMTLVRHICAAHGVDVAVANQEVDDIYKKLNGNYKMAQVPNPVPPIDHSGYMTVPYEYLSAKDCEKLKISVIDKEEDYVWGTTGPKRDEELQKYSIKNLSTQHLENILITQPHVENELAAAILMLLKKRYGAL